ncbi:MAG TPA: hypothetical protein VFR24_15890, partial [Candidatus Angelobacter sp.]|nr:hypothetical protein [Candidatus Angelobacter sp.]
TGTAMMQETAKTRTVITIATMIGTTTGTKCNWPRIDANEHEYQKNSQGLIRVFGVDSRLDFACKNQASCDESQDARQPSPRTALPPRVSLDLHWPFVHVTLVTSGQNFNISLNINRLEIPQPIG